MKTLVIIGKTVTIDGVRHEVNISLPSTITAVQYNSTTGICREEPLMKEVALNKYQNFIDKFNEIANYVPVLTEEEILAEQLRLEQEAISNAKKTGGIYTSLTGVDYSIPLTKEDADGLIQVYIGFTLGFITSTNFVFSNDVILPINSQEELMHLGGWFISQRNSFFVDLI